MYYIFIYNIFIYNIYLQKIIPIFRCKKKCGYASKFFKKYFKYIELLHILVEY